MQVEQKASSISACRLKRLRSASKWRKSAVKWSKKAKQIQNTEDKISRTEKELAALQKELKAAEENFMAEDENLIKTLYALQNLAPQTDRISVCSAADPGRDYSQRDAAARNRAFSGRRSRSNSRQTQQYRRPKKAKSNNRSKTFHAASWRWKKNIAK